MDRTTKRSSGYHIEPCHDTKKNNCLPGVKLVLGKWSTTCKPKKGEKPPILITILIDVCSKRHQCANQENPYIDPHLSDSVYH